MSVAPSLLLVILLLATLLLSGCQAGAAPDPAESATAIATAMATGTATAAPTEPPTATPTEPPGATATESPTATPAVTDPAPTAAPDTEVLNYVTAHGGGPALVWEQENAARYEEMHPGVEVTVRGVGLYSNPVPTGFYRFLDDEEQPDVYSSFIVGRLRSYVAGGTIADISDLWQENGWHEVFPETMQEAVTIDGRQYFVPMAQQWNPIWYRTDVFAEVGLAPPQTWDDFLAACDTLHEAGYVPVAVASVGWTPPMARWFSILNLRLNGPAYHEALMAGQECYDDARVRAVFEHLAQLFEHNCFDAGLTGYREAAQQIFEGEAAMVNLGEWLSESAPEGLPDTLDFFPFPVLDADVPRGEIVHLYGAYMPAAAAHPEEARRFLTYLGSAASQTSNVETLGRVASHLQVDPALYNDVYRRGLTFVEEADSITTLFEFNTHPDVAAAGLRALGSFWQNQDMEAAIAALEAARERAYGP